MSRSSYVKGLLSLSFSFNSVFVFAVVVRLLLPLHLVSIRTLSEPLVAL